MEPVDLARRCARDVTKAAVRRWTVALTALALSAGCIARHEPAEELGADSAAHESTTRPAGEILRPLDGSVILFDGAYGFEDGALRLYTTLKGSPAVFQVIDVATNTHVRSIPLEKVGTVWRHRVGLDGSVYIATESRLFRYDAKTKTAGVVATLTGESLIFSMAIGPGGEVYLGTYPSGKVWRYDPTSSELRDLGRVVGLSAQEYVRSIAFADGAVYAGTSHAQIFRIDPANGAKVEIAEPLHETGFAYDLTAVDDRYLFARFDVSKRGYVYDTRTRAWFDTHAEQVSGLHVPETSLDGKIYFVGHGAFTTFDLVSQKVESTGVRFGTGLRGAQWVTLNDPEMPGQSLATVLFGGNAAFFNPVTKKVKTQPSVVEPTANIIEDLGTGPDGRIYASGMQAAFGSAYDPSAHTFTTFAMGQADSIHTVGRKMFFGVYPGEGRVFLLDPFVAFGRDNPKLIHTIGHEQNRIRAQAAGDRWAFFGSIPDYGKLGGAITIHDLEAHTFETHRPYADQSVVGLAYADGILYGSTNVNGGLGSTPTADSARLFAWDVAEKRVIREIRSPVPERPDARWMGGLSVGPDGLLWGATSGALFALEPKTLRLVKSRVLFPEDRDYGVWASVPMDWTERGWLVAAFGTKIVAIDVESWNFRQLGSGTRFTLTKDGWLYHSDANDKTIMRKVRLPEAI